MTQMTITGKYGAHTITFEDSIETKEEVFQCLLNWYTVHGCYDGESIWQNDAPQEKAPEVLTDIAEKLFKFQVVYDDDI